MEILINTYYSNYVLPYPSNSCIPFLLGYLKKINSKLSPQTYFILKYLLILITLENHLIMNH